MHRLSCQEKWSNWPPNGFWGEATIDFIRLNKLEEFITQTIEKNYQPLLKQFPINDYIILLDKQPSSFDYHDLSEETKNYCNKITQITSDLTLYLYHKLVLINLIKRSYFAIRHKALTEEIRLIYRKYFGGIITQITENSDDFYQHSNEKFSKDLAICRLKMIPVGSVLMEEAKLPKRFLTKKGIKQFTRGIVFVLGELKRFSPLYQMHLDSRPGSISLAEFNPEGWERTFMRIAELLKIHTHIRGVFGIGWFCDPKLETISPRLGFTRELFLKNGGKLFYYGTSKECIMDALYKSLTRRRLYAAHLYMPTSYILVWSRDKLITWADRSAVRERRKKPSPRASALQV